MPVFGEDPAPYLEELGVELPGFLDPEASAVLDADHVAFVNWEAYFFSTPALRDEFLRLPERYCGLVTDPVSRERFRPDESSPRLDHGGRPYFFRSEETLATFRESPEMYALPRHEMMEPAPDAGT